MCKTGFPASAIAGDLLQVAAKLPRLRKFRTLRDSFVHVHHNSTHSTTKFYSSIYNAEITKDWR